MDRNLRRPRPDGARRLDLDRRRFLALAGAGAALGALPALAKRAVALELPLSVGYLEGSEELPSLSDLPWQTSDAESVIVPAVRIPSGDSTLALEPLTVRVAGLYPGSDWPRRLRPRSIALDVLFEPFDPYLPSPLPFAAWSYRAAPAPTPSAPVRFSFQMEATDGLALDLRVEDPEYRSYQFRTAFTVDDSDGLARLRRGIYFLSLYPGAFDRARKLPGMASPPDFGLASLVMSVQGRPATQPPGQGVKPRR